MNQTAQPMNVLFVMTDQHQAMCTGYEGHKQAITPHMDRLAAEGMQFRHCYTANPICTPTRVSILSGQYCHNHGFYGLDGPTPMHLPSFLKHFRRHGYRTAGIGKLHLPHEPHEWARDHCDLYMDVNGRHQDGYVYLQYLREHGYENEFDACWLAELGQGNNPMEARPSKMPFAQSVEGYATHHAMKFIDDAVAADKPFCMEVSYHRPHQCYAPAQEFWDMYDDDLELPPGALEDLNPDRPQWFLDQAAQTRRAKGKFEPTDPVSRLKRIWKGYLACLTHCDHGLGLLLDHLEKLGIADHTIVVYSADHGAYTGTFGINEKAPGICSEQVCRIPMLWRVPGVTKAGHRCDQLAHIVDLAPTLTSLCGLPEMDWVDGQDLTGLLQGGSKAVREAAVTEHPWSRSIRWKNWRMVHYQRRMFDGEDVGELYDIAADPLETTNLYASTDHQSVVQEGRRLLLEWLIDTMRTVTYLGPISRSGKHGEYDIGEDGKLANGAGPEVHLKSRMINYL